jgi:hypothetical protein
VTVAPALSRIHQISIRAHDLARAVTFRSAPHMIATLPDREVWLADFEDSEGNVLALMSEPRV